MDTEKYCQLKQMVTELYEALKDTNDGPIGGGVTIEELQRDGKYYMVYLALRELIAAEF